VAPVHPDLSALVNRQLASLGYDGKPLSYRRAAKRAEDHGHPLSPETIRQIAVGRKVGRIEDATVDALAVALDSSRPEILRAMHEERQKPLGEWEPPAAAAQLSLRQRRALEQLISVMVSPYSVADDPEAPEADDLDRESRQLTLLRNREAHFGPAPIAGNEDLREVARNRPASSRPHEEETWSE
jgi:hypothetical protein